jgi:hypothetical protein
MLRRQRRWTSEIAQNKLELNSGIPTSGRGDTIDDG